MAPGLDERPRHLRWTPSTPSTGTTAALFVHGDAYDAAMGRSYRWVIICTWTHATGKTIPQHREREATPWRGKPLSALRNRRR